ncbi:MAG: hypothetical protein Q4D57_02160, partial [Clostridia bacterium]|nr:hypothetical protein [Clostridia bacterium]
MFISSLPTTQAKKKLEEIKSEEVNGKQLLKDFLERDLKNIFARQTSAKAVMDAAEKPNSNIYKFAMLLNTKS